MHPLKLAGATLATLAIVTGVFVQFVPWGSVESSGGSIFGFTFPDAKFEAKTWESEASSGSNSQATSWYDSDHDDSDGIGQIRFGVPLLLAGLVVGVAGALVLWLVPGAGGAIVTLVGGLLSTVGTVLVSTGIAAILGDANRTWELGFYFAIATSALLIVGGVLGLVALNVQGMRSTTQS